MSADPGSRMQADRRGRSWRRRLLFLPPVIAGIAALALMGRGGPDVEHGAPGEQARPVRVVEATPTRVVPKAIGYGLVAAAREFRAVAQVPGRIISLSSALEPGRIIPSGTDILQIDPADTALTLARLESEVERIGVQIDELSLQEANLEASRQLEAETLALAEQNVARKRALLARGTGTQADLDTALSDRLRVAVGLQSIENELSLLPAERRLLAANLAQAEAERDEAQLDLERTSISTPIAGRVASVPVEVDQYVGVGTELAVLEGIARAEISARLTIDDLFPLISEIIDPAMLIDLTQVSRVVPDLGLTARVRLSVDGITAEWQAEVDRLGDMVDPSTRTVGVVVAVDDPYGSTRPGERPPLANGLFVEVVIQGPPRSEQLVVPRTAVIRDSNGAAWLHVAALDDRLSIRPVSVGLRQDDYVVIDAGLAPGERVVISDLAPASDGMALTPERDHDVENALIRLASGLGDGA